ncbi:MAG: DotD/TraH family lipoprotein [Pseudomonadota bacterium]
MNKKTQIQRMTLFSVGLLLTLSACSHSPFDSVKTKREPQVLASPDKVSLMLAEAADKASNALETLAAVEQERSPAVAVQPIHNAPPELNRSMTLSWVGPADQITKLLADRASYSFLTIGNAPPVPLIVDINVRNRPVIEILRDVGLQLGKRADIKVDATSEIIELHYSPITGRGG